MHNSNLLSVLLYDSQTNKQAQCFLGAGAAGIICGGTQ